MERLTKRDKYGHWYTDTVIYDRGMTTRDGIHYEKDNSINAYDGEPINKLAEYEDLEEQGLLLRLPCKVGDTIYILAGRFGNYFEEDICDGFFIGRDGVLHVKVKSNTGNHGTYGVIGSTAFLTIEEAEKALADMVE